MAANVYPDTEKEPKFEARLTYIGMSRYTVCSLNPTAVPEFRAMFNSFDYIENARLSLTSFGAPLPAAGPDGRADFFEASEAAGPVAAGQPKADEIILRFDYQTSMSGNARYMLKLFRELLDAAERFKEIVGMPRQYAAGVTYAETDGTGMAELAADGCAVRLRPARQQILRAPLPRETARRISAILSRLGCRLSTDELSKASGTYPENMPQEVWEAFYEQGFPGSEARKLRAEWTGRNSKTLTVTVPKDTAVSLDSLNLDELGKRAGAERTELNVNGTLIVGSPDGFENLRRLNFFKRHGELHLNGPFTFGMLRTALSACDFERYDLSSAEFPDAVVIDASSEAMKNSDAKITPSPQTKVERREKSV